jgi:hypothetical protein
MLSVSRPNKELSLWGIPRYHRLYVDERQYMKISFEVEIHRNEFIELSEGFYDWEDSETAFNLHFINTDPYKICYRLWLI